MGHPGMPWGKLDYSVSLEWSLSFCLTDTRLLLLIPTPVEAGRKGSLDKGSTSYMAWAMLPRVCQVSQWVWRTLSYIAGTKKLASWDLQASRCGAA